MAYLGRSLDRGNYLKLDDISSQFNGSSKTFNLTSGGNPFYPGSAFSILVSLGGVVQEPESAYTIDQYQITFASAPGASDDFFCIALGVALGIGVPGEGTVTGTKLSKPFNYNNNHLTLDTVNTRVGINSSTPGYTLDINGDINFNGIFYQNGSQFVASRWTAGAGTTIYRNSSVGIGTTNPTSTLQVQGTVSVSSTTTSSEFVGGGSDLRNLSGTHLVSYASASDISNSALSIAGISTYNQVGILTGSLAVDASDLFGYSVATSADGKTIIVGAVIDEIGATAGTGVVYVYDRVGSSFNQVGILTGSLAVDASDNFGISVATSADGKTIIVGAYFDEIGANNGSGVVYVFDRVGSSFNQVGILTGSFAGDASDLFGQSVATSADGKTIIVGARGDEIGATTSTGVVYVFDRVGSSFNQVGILTGSLAVDSNDLFGWSVATSADGKTIVVGAYSDEIGATTSTGVVYVYDRVGNSFNQVGILTGSLAVDASDLFGYSVATSADGKTIVVGAYTDEIGATISTGVVYVYDRIGNSFNQVGILTGSLAVDSNDFFGLSVATSADGKTIVVGARGDEIGATTGTGVAYIFKRQGNTFNQVGILTGSLAVDSNDFFGQSVATSADGKTIIVGAYTDEIGATTSTGVAYVFDETRDTYVYSGPTGNIGIGTTNPTSKLQVVGDVLVSGIITATSFSGGGANLTSLTAGNLSGTIPSGVLGNSTLYVGTTAVTLNRSSASQSLTGINIDGSSGSCTGNSATATTATNQSGGTVSATTGSFSSQITSTQANSTATGGGQIYLNGSTGNRIDFAAVGVVAPTLTTRSLGTKIVLYPSLSATNADYAFGIESATLWSSVSDSTSQFKWYAGTTNIATLSGAGNLSVTGTVTGTNTYGYSIPDTSGTSSYILLGTWTTGQGGYTLYINVVSHQGFNADATQNQVTRLYFKTSNGSSNAGGFYGDALAYREVPLGSNNGSPASFRIVQVSTSSYAIYGSFSTYTSGSTYQLQYPSYTTWTHSGTLVAAPTGTYIDVTPTSYANFSTFSDTVTLTTVPFFRNTTTIASNYTVTTSYNEMSIGPITINSGITVTVNSGATWTVV